MWFFKYPLCWIYPSTPLCQLTVAVLVIGHIYLGRTRLILASCHSQSKRSPWGWWTRVILYIVVTHKFLSIHQISFENQIRFVFLKNTDNGFMFATHVEPHLLLKNSFVFHEGLEHIPILWMGILSSRCPRNRQLFQYKFEKN